MSSLVCRNQMRLPAAVIIAVAVAMGLSGCLAAKPRLAPLAAPLAKKTGDAAPGPGKAEELYVRQQVVAAPVDEARAYDGSLFSEEDHRGHLITMQLPPARGKFIKVLTRLRGRLEADRLQSKDSPEAAAPVKADGGDAEKAKLDADIEEALAALPDMTEEQKQDLRFLESLTFEVIDVNRRGDARVRFARASDNAEDYRHQSVEAVIPSESFVGVEPLTTDQLRNVRFLQISDSSRIERSSVEWQDEYLVRISGFSEVKSIAAKALDQKRDQLLKARADVEAKLRQVGQERLKFAAERQQYVEAQSKDRAKIGNLEQAVKDKDEQIKDLTPDPEDVEAEVEKGKGNDGQKKN